MPNYKSRDEINEDENPTGGAMEVLNMYGANQIVPKKEVPVEDKNNLLGGMLSDIMNNKKPHRSMIRAVLNMKPKDIHIIKRSAKRPKNWIKNDIFIKGIDEIDINNGFSVELWYDEQEENNTIQIFGDNGLIELEIINTDTIKEL